jgi:hypothetical protein
MNNRTLTYTLVLPAGTPAGTYERQTILDSTYQRASGVVAYVTKDGGVPGTKLGLRDDTAVYVSPTHMDHLRAGVDCPKRDRLTPVNIVCNNTNLTVQAVLPYSLASELNIDVVFQLERDAR